MAISYHQLVVLIFAAILIAAARPCNASAAVANRWVSNHCARNSHLADGCLAKPTPNRYSDGCATDAHRTARCVAKPTPN